MRKWIQGIGGKLGIPSVQSLIHLVILEIIINYTWDRVSKMFTIDYVREIGFLVVTVAGIFAVAWYFPKLAPEYMGGRTKGTSRVRTPRTQLKYDGVLWEEGGFNTWGNRVTIGPLCPEDYTPLAIKHNDKIDTNVNFDKFISDSSYHSTLLCLKCKTEYTLGTEVKQLQNSRAEVSILFEGKRRREQQT